MTLTADPAERRQREYECPCCSAAIERMWNYVYRDGVMRAVYFANCYHHKDQPHDAWIDVIMGTWGDDDIDDHVTFGCRVGPVQDSVFPAATLVDALTGFGSTPVHGVVLTRVRDSPPAHKALVFAALDLGADIVSHACQPIPA